MLLISPVTFAQRYPIGLRKMSWTYLDSWKDKSCRTLLVSISKWLYKPGTKPEKYTWSPYALYFQKSVDIKDKKAWSYFVVVKSV